MLDFLHFTLKSHCGKAKTGLVRRNRNQGVLLSTHQQSAPNSRMDPWSFLPVTLLSWPAELLASSWLIWRRRVGHVLPHCTHCYLGLHLLWVSHTMNLESALLYGHYRNIVYNVRWELFSSYHGYLVKWVQRRAIQMIRVMEHPSYKERLKELSFWRDPDGKTEILLQEHVVTGQGEMD